jgi:hypothetical protein
MGQQVARKIWLTTNYKNITYLKKAPMLEVEKLQVSPKVTDRSYALLRGGGHEVVGCVILW